MESIVHDMNNLPLKRKFKLNEVGITKLLNPTDPNKMSFNLENENASLQHHPFPEGLAPRSLALSDLMSFQQKSL
ncbi:hypothetical protein TRFO_34290 [Tritrichomonas foetus]|uniref:Uncharacterized protein n=1 Tax=Tritrichomonas foetus TaxID=1144522 RepID=A0A1J4JQ12_9EUKA|nr:hypothetical protein TRFO_34290 [Tritrichomonas foetus]|eukprot:OHS99316.1 hypothetical protein TRFO_34290 [Tritrichomonas foetus]